MSNSKSATERLRELLDEYGSEWHSGLESVTFVDDWCFVEYDDGRLAATCEPALTPEQAIAATLDARTCRNTEQLPLAWSFTCSECGVHSITEGERFNYCPNCGRKVVD